MKTMNRRGFFGTVAGAACLPIANAPANVGVYQDGTLAATSVEQLHGLGAALGRGRG
jgi:hypothetical protein